MRHSLIDKLLSRGARARLHTQKACARASEHHRAQPCVLRFKLLETLKDLPLAELAELATDGRGEQVRVRWVRWVQSPSRPAPPPFLYARTLRSFGRT